MSIVVNLTPKVEAQFREKAAQQGRDVALVAAEILATALEWEAQDIAEAVAGIQQGLDAFEAGRYRSFDKLSQEQSPKYTLLLDE